MNLSIIIPVYNEGENIVKTINRIEEKVKVSHEVLLVYDFPEDSTLPFARKLIKKYPHIRLVLNKYGKGVLKAIKTGFKEAEGESVLLTMADFSDDPKTINLMYEEFRKGYDLICGSRYIKGGGQIGAPFFKSWLSRMAGASAHFILNLPTHDLTNSFKMYRRSLLKKIRVESGGGFELGMEIVLKSFFLGAKITEVPTVWRERTVGKSRFKLFSWLPKYLYWYIWAIRRKFLRFALK